jgi:hypothetical protein
MDSDAAAVGGREGEAVLMHHFEVGLVGHLVGFLDRLALGCDARQLGHKTLKPPSGSGCSTIPYSHSILMW